MKRRRCSFYNLIFSVVKHDLSLFLLTQYTTNVHYLEHVLQEQKAKIPKKVQCPKPYIHEKYYKSISF